MTKELLNAEAVSNLWAFLAGKRQMIMLKFSIFLIILVAILKKEVLFTNNFSLEPLTSAFHEVEKFAKELQGK